MGRFIFVSIFVSCFFFFFSLWEDFSDGTPVSELVRFHQHPAMVSEHECVCVSVRVSK